MSDEKKPPVTAASFLPVSSLARTLALFRHDTD
jgi:hypothetical protein